MRATAGKFARERERMVETQLRSRGIQEPHILEAFRSVPREKFVANANRRLAYGDHPLPIRSGQTISQPYIVALMVQAAEIGPADTVLEVGSGSGYAAAIIGSIADRVVGIERQSELAAIAQERLQGLGFDNVTIVEGDGTGGWPAGAPYDAIVVSASGSHVPQALTDQLAEGGRLVIPLGRPNDIQELVKLTKQSGGETIEERLGSVRFVPLIGEEGWNEAKITRLR